MMKKREVSTVASFSRDTEESHYYLTVIDYPLGRWIWYSFLDKLDDQIMKICKKGKIFNWSIDHLELPTADFRVRGGTEIFGYTNGLSITKEQAVSLYPNWNWGQ